MKKKNGWIYFCIILLTIYGIVVLIKKCKDNSVPTEKEQATLVAALQDSLKYFKDKDSVNTARITVLQTESSTAFTKLQVRDSQVNKLMELVKTYEGKLKAGSSVTRATLVTQISTDHKPTAELPTVDTGELAVLYPIYTDSLENKWIKYKIRMDSENSYVDIKVFNEFSVTIGYEDGKPFADLKTDNPYSAVKELKTFQVKIPKEKPKRFGIGLSSGITYYNGKINPYLGIGLNYNILRF